MPEINLFILHPNEPHCMEILAALTSLDDADLVPQILTDLRRAPDDLRRLKAQIVIVAVDTPNDPTIRTIDEISRVMGDDVAIVVVTKNPTRDVIVPCTRVGADDFVDFPIEPAALRDAIDRQLQRKGVKTAEEGKVIALFSGKGGIGTTLLACNLAINVATELKVQKASCLFDLNVQFGVAADMMDMKCKYSVIDAAKDIDRMDDALFMEYVAVHDSGAHLLAAPSTFAEVETPSPEVIGKLIDMCRFNFRFTFLDLPHVMDDITIPVLDQADEIFLLCDLLFPTIKNTQKVIDAFHSLEYKNEKIRLIITGYHQSDKVGLRDINSALKLPTYWLIPYDSLLARESIDAGVSVASIGETSDLADSLISFAQFVAGVPIKQRHKKKKGLLGFLGG